MIRSTLARNNAGVILLIESSISWLTYRVRRSRLEEQLREQNERSFLAYSQRRMSIEVASFQGSHTHSHTRMNVSYSSSLHVCQFSFSILRHSIAKSRSERFSRMIRFGLGRLTREQGGHTSSEHRLHTCCSSWWRGSLNTEPFLSHHGRDH